MQWLLRYYSEKYYLKMAQSIKRAATFLARNKISRENIDSYVAKRLLDLKDCTSMANHVGHNCRASNENIYLINNESSFKLDISEVLEKFQGIRLIGCKDFLLYGLKSIEIDDLNHTKSIISLIDCSLFEAAHLNMRGGRNHIYTDGSRDFRIANISSASARGCGLTIFNSHNCQVLDCNFTNTLSSGINIIGKSSYIQIENAQVRYSSGPYNRDAGINIMHCTSNINEEKIPDKCHENKSILAKTCIPSFINISNSLVHGCNAQGIYLEGPAFVNICNSIISDNRKEGICFDWGTSFCNLRESTIARNGKRNNYSDEDCKIDFLDIRHRDFEMTHQCQISGVSLDNAYSNCIQMNFIHGNYGGGIKLIRSCFENKFSENKLIENSNFLKSYDPNTRNCYEPSEVMVLSHGREQEFTEVGVSNLDFLASKENVFLGNSLANHNGNFYKIYGDLNEFNTFSDALIPGYSQPKNTSSVSVTFTSVELMILKQSFDPDRYLEINPDVANAKIDPLTHYIEYGKKEGRSIN